MVLVTRNLTRSYQDVRERSKLLRPSMSSSVSRLGSGADGTKKGLLAHVGDLEEGIELGMKLPPVWVDIVESMKLDLAKIQTEMNNLQKLMNERMKVSFGSEEKAKDIKIDIKTNEINDLIKKCENKIKMIGTKGLTEGAKVLSQEDRQVRVNVMKGMGARLSNITRKFRKLQNTFVEQMEAHDKADKDDFYDERQALHEAEEEQMTLAQLAAFDDAKKDMEDRGRAVAQVAKSVRELATVFKELSVLVVDQGSILDRIDHNVEQTLGHLVQANKELTTAKKYQDSTRSLWCIGFLVLGIIICIAILAAKNRKK